jgi:hypothetical protein
VATTLEPDASSSPARPVAGGSGSAGSTIGTGSTTGFGTASSSTTSAGAGRHTDGTSRGRGSDAGDAVHQAADAVKERAGAIWDDAREAARARLSEQKDEAADGLGAVAGALRDAAQRQGDDSSARPIARLTGSAADSLERLSGTLRSKDVGSIVRDVENFARNQPVAFFGLALAAGFLAARFLKASND